MGPGVGERMAAMMKLQQPKRDQAVVYDAEEWIDDMLECKAMGVLQLPCNYRLTGLRASAKDRIREQMHSQDAEMRDTTYEEERCNKQPDTSTRQTSARDSNIHTRKNASCARPCRASK